MPMCWHQNIGIPLVTDDTLQSSDGRPVPPSFQYGFNSRSNNLD